MKAATIHQLKSELKEKSPSELLEYCLRLARFKKDNKELLSYLIFEAEDENGYINYIKEEITEQFLELNTDSLYYTKKGLRKTVRYIDKCIRYSGQKETDIRIRMHFIDSMNGLNINWRRSVLVHNIYDRQLKKISTQIAKLHPDLQYDYKQELESLG